MSDLEILKEAYETLDNLEIPVKYTEKLSIPIVNTSNRLKVLYKAVMEAVQKKNEAPAEPEAEPAPEAEEN